MTENLLFAKSETCENNHENHYYDPSIDAYVCSTCNAISPANSIYDFEEKADDEYELHIGI
ncbi:hypothetical protein HX045_05935 [Myroides odoratimimus]|uniref:Uncharacterized protein n=1 Tax=Myroides profundi TaxID=480520 RepID=A0AAJ4W1Y8_MYRPR|nr:MULTISPECIES: hypothetical protein [Myroides]EHO10023.1 hypothetical protein HMPREF9714_01708 [Myroides odoratimimus CCUG 12901]EKB07105.1 hypothetical protein HMPREF9711_00415 [Myroides odoratimimus CCUG 3837]MCA4792260.1 hypothetical protein [Myroides odoratimimus]MCA4806224.1 hypothetical protein [Myroides odoratimimus]MCA4819521.1 hypothetical protein [Myroides odoratimimus]